MYAVRIDFRSLISVLAGLLLLGVSPGLQAADDIPEVGSGEVSLLATAQSLGGGGACSETIQIEENTARLTTSICFELSASMGASFGPISVGVTLGTCTTCECGYSYRDPDTGFEHFTRRAGFICEGGG